MNHVEVSTDAHILTIRLSRPEKKNALTGRMYMALAAALNRASDDEVIRVVLLSAEGDFFTAGNDISEFTSMVGDFAEAPPAQFIHAITHCRKPIVAAVNGPAIGVGMTMLLHCDLVYAAQKATFSAPFVNMALAPEAGSSWLMPERFGYQRAAAILLLAETLDADTALRMGLINEVVVDQTVEVRAQAIALRLAEKAPKALARARDLMRSRNEPFYAHMLVEMQAFAESLQNAEAAEAFAAFLQKRKPNFSMGAS